MKDRCTRFLSYDVPVSPRETLLRLADYAGDAAADQSGQGELVERLEGRIAELLGKPAAVFMPAGKTAQNIALKLWCARSGSNRIAIHPRSHMEEWEDKAYAEAFGLTSVAFGHHDRQVALEDVASLREPVGAAAIELALRPLGCALIPWTELEQISQAVRERKIPLHTDAARLWESQPFYDRPLAEIAGLFDSLYVSLYKSIGGLAGSALAGPKNLIDEARLWQHRLGQKPYRQFPYLLAALKGLEERLPLMPAFHQKAVEIAAAFSTLEDVFVTPEPPHTNAFLVLARGDRRKQDAARDQVAEETGLWLYEYAPPAPYEGFLCFEVHIWTAALELSSDELRDALSRFFELVR